MYITHHQQTFVSYLRHSSRVHSHSHHAAAYGDVGNGGTKRKNTYPLRMSAMPLLPNPDAKERADVPKETWRVVTSYTREEQVLETQNASAAPTATADANLSAAVLGQEKAEHKSLERVKWGVEGKRAASRHRKTEAAGPHSNRDASREQLAKEEPPEGHSTTRTMAKGPSRTDEPSTPVPPSPRRGSTDASENSGHAARAANGDGCGGEQAHAQSGAVRIETQPDCKWRENDNGEAESVTLKKDLGLGDELKALSMSEGD